MTTNLLFYRGGSNGLAEYYTINRTAELSYVKRYTDFAPDWKKILPVECVWDAYKRKLRVDVLFYGSTNIKSAPHGSLYQVGNSGEISHLRDHTVLSKSWSEIVAIPFQFHTNLFFYDKLTGTAEVRRYISSGQLRPDFDESEAKRGEGNLPLLRTYQNVSKTWTHIIPGTFGGEYGGLLIYDGQAGTGIFYQTTRNGDLQHVKTFTDFSTGWTHIVPIPFGFRTDLFFYNQTTLRGEIYHLDDQGNMDMIKKYPNGSFSRWSQIIAMPFENNFRGPLLFFYDGGNVGEFYHINGLGEFERVRRDTTYQSGWDHIVVIPGFMPSPVYRVRMHAVIGCNENDPINLKAAVEYSTKELPATIAGANRIFKEAGIHLDYDPLTDADIVPSEILNHDILPDNSTNQNLDPTSQIGIWEGAAVAEQIAWRCRNKLVLFNRDYLRGSTYSTFCQQEVVFSKGCDDGRTLAHEMGHYLRLIHPFSDYPADFEKFRNDIKAWVESQPEAKKAINEHQPIHEDLFEPIVWQNLDIDRFSNVDQMIEDTQNVADTPIDLGPNVFRWTHVVPASSDAVLFYDGRTGNAAIERLHGDGALENLRSFSDFSRNWTHIVSVSSGVLFFYKSHKGEGTFLRVNADGTVNTLHTYTDFSRDWTHIVGVSDGVLFFYKSHKGEGTFLRVNADGTVSTLHMYTDFSRDWTHIVGVSGCLLFFYKSKEGEGAVLKVNTDGTVSTLHTYIDGSFGKDWSHIIAANGNMHIYYSSYLGTAAIAKLQSDGTVVTLRNYDDPAEYKCSGVLRVVVDFSTGQQHTYVINPDRANVMAYYLQLSCSKPFHFSPDQIHVMRHALQHPNRRHLVAPYEFVIKDCPGCQ
jgi:hypothetical protein